MEDSVKTLENIKGEIPVLSLDSTIESIFYEKCIRRSTLIPILMEWANSKKIYCGHTNLIIGMYGNYSRHDCTHSVAILEGILAVIGKNRIENMDIMDLWLLLHCAYAHDLGMPYSYNEAIELWRAARKNSEFSAFLNECRISDDEDTRTAVKFIDVITNIILPELSNKENNIRLVQEFTPEWPVIVHRYYTYLTSEYCRKHHAHRTKEILEKNLIEKKCISPYNIEDRLYRFVGLCSEMHGKSFVDLLSISHKEWTPLGYCHPAFVAAILRLGDLLDIDNNRFDSIALSYYGDLNKTSEIHKKKHESIVHIDYEVNKIEITAKSDDEDVCRCASDWFQYLDSEVKNIIFHWAEIAPKSLGGCQFSVPKTTIYLNGQEFRKIANHEFQVNKEMLINLVIGRNLYNSKLDFIREYLQNSLDAVKMKLWLELKDEQNGHYIKQDHFEQWKSGDAYSVTPFFFNEYVYDNYRIDVTCKWDVVDNDHPFVIITINDRGIGIDEECVDAISHIGSGWNRRKKYREDLEKMPAWLKPTGGFGIGMQSGFMIAETIKITTKCEGEISGREITLHSSAATGRIEEKRIMKKHKGTSVSVKIPYEWFLDEKNFSFYNLKISNEVKDYFVPASIMVGVYTIIKDYIETIAGNSLFPIYVSREGFSADIIGNKILKDLEFKEVQVDGLSYEIYFSKTKEVVYIWEKSRAVLCTIETNHSFEESQLVWAYKGMKVWPEMNDTESVIARVFGNVSVDIMGIDVEDCLAVDRSKFALEFDHLSLLLQLLKAYTNSFNSISELLSCDISNTGSDFGNFRKEDCYKILLCKRLLEKENQRQEICDFLKSIGDNDERFLSSSSLFVECASINLDTFVFDLNRLLLPHYCNMFWQDTDGDILFCGKEFDFSIIKVPPNMASYSYKSIIIDKSIYAIMGIFTNSFLLLDKDIGIKCLYNRSLKISKDEDINLVFDNALNCVGKQRIFYTKKYFEKLWVSSIPFMSVQEYQEQLNSGKMMIISPINPTNSSEDIIIKEIKGKDNTIECFREYVMGKYSFKYLVDWVVGHQIVPHKYNREEIVSSYMELIDLIFKNEVVPALDRKS